MQAERGDDAVWFIESVAADLPDEMDVATTVVFTRDRPIGHVANRCDGSLSRRDSIETPGSVVLLGKSDSGLNRKVSTLGTLFEDNNVEIRLIYVLGTRRPYANGSSIPSSRRSPTGLIGHR